MTSDPAIPAPERFPWRDNPSPVSLPPQAQDLVDEVLAGFDGTQDSVPAAPFNQFTSWCEVHGFEAQWVAECWTTTGLGTSYFYATPLVALRNVFSDEDLRAWWGWTAIAPVTDADRLRFMADRVADQFGTADMNADVSPVCAALPIWSRSGKAAVIGFGISGYSFSGVTTTWYGVFPDLEAFRGALRREGYLTSVPDFESLGSTALDLWSSE